MKKLITIALALLLAFSLIGCGDTEGGPAGIGGTNGEEILNIGDGWPPASELAQFGLSSWQKPEGISNITWGTVSMANQLQLGILFSAATAASAGAIDSYLPTVNYPFAFGSPINTGPTHYHSIFEKEDATYTYAANYTFDVPAGGGIQILRQKKESPPVPQGNFTITGTRPGTVNPNSPVYARTTGPFTVVHFGTNPMALVESEGIGALVGSNNTVFWAKTPPNGTYTIFLEDDGTPLYAMVNNVQITDGGGSVAWDSFVPMPIGTP